MNRTVVLVGMMGAGKSAVGKALAARLQVPFLDSDVEIENAAQMSIAEIFARDGENFFRARESEVIERLLSEHRGVLSTGGGAFLHPTNRALFSKLGVAVWLEADLSLLWNRVKHKNTRPLLRTANPKKTLEELCETRNPAYALADLRVRSLPGYSIEQMAARVIVALSEHGEILEKCDD